MFGFPYKQSVTDEIRCRYSYRARMMIIVRLLDGEVVVEICVTKAELLLDLMLVIVLQ